jgi:cytochrome c oxidase subunit 1
MIAKQFLITGMAMAVIAMILSILFRIQLAYPDKTFPLLETLLGRFAPGGRLDSNFYLSLVTIHGTIMVFFVLTAGLSGTFANLAYTHCRLGARDMASPFMNMLSYWFFFMASVVMLSSFLVQKGPASGGWTIYPPLSALPKAMPGSGMGMTLWLISMVLFIASSLMGGINYVSTILNMRTKGMDLWKMPLSIWALFLTAILGYPGIPCTGCRCGIINIRP